MLKSIDNLSLRGEDEKIHQDMMVEEMENNLNTVVDGIHANSLPNTKNDSRKLLDNNIITKLNIDQQFSLYINLTTLIQEGIFDTEKSTNDEVVKIYNEGVHCTLAQILYDLNNKNDLYYLDAKYKRITGALIVLFEEISDIPEVNYAQTNIKGKLAGFTNFIEILEDRINKEENLIFRQTDLQPLR